MSEPKDVTFSVHLIQLADQLRKRTALWLTNALQTDVDPKAEYARLILAMQCTCLNCYCFGCAIAEENCNAAQVLASASTNVRNILRS